MRTEYEPGLVSIIIPVYNRWEALSVCLDSVAQQSYRPLEVIIVDDGSSIPRPDANLSARQPIVVRLSGNYGPGHARNRGYLESRGEFLHFLDSDVTFPNSDAICEAVAFLRSRPDVGALGGEVPAPSGAPPPGKVLGRRIGLLGRSFPVCPETSAGVGKATVIDCDFVASCNLVVGRRQFELVGGFDPYFGFGGEDREFCWRIRQLGLVVYASQLSAVYHHYAPGGRTADVHFRYELALLRYVFKTGSWFSRSLVVAISLAKLGVFYPLLPAKLACYLGMRRHIDRGHLNSGYFLAKALWQALRELPWTLARRGRDFLCLEEIKRFERALQDRTWVL